ncbi:uncharacterized protein SCHCODRAFT_02638093 [Schizophyllum commune H4-8]|uniref:uncharacterized protein n=1 Tax=Schizophyllum commune (strain H4-8 / FGSC 9210) TaxID=578458 RepID=UPI00215EA486|nr:uncharacterized protein SCHCODRAFT_02638093 [Schizophyllum commune H4-8]KAI5887428.1 hypothetical protein SCHCODRAFT_02638093 [Schizophyllum commune H4-8]
MLVSPVIIGLMQASPVGDSSGNSLSLFERRQNIVEHNFIIDQIAHRDQCPLISSDFTPVGCFHDIDNSWTSFLAQLMETLESADELGKPSAPSLPFLEIPAMAIPEPREIATKEYNADLPRIAVIVDQQPDWTQYDHIFIAYYLVYLQILSLMLLVGYAVDTTPFTITPENAPTKSVSPILVYIRTPPPRVTHDVPIALDVRVRPPVMKMMRFNWEGRSHAIPMSTDSDNYKLHVYMAARGLYSGWPAEFSPSSSARTLRWPLSSVASLQRTASRAAHFILLTIAELPRATTQVIDKTITKVHRAVTQVICRITHILLVLRHALKITVGVITLVSCRVFELVVDVAKRVLRLALYTAVDVVKHVLPDRDAVYNLETAHTTMLYLSTPLAQLLSSLIPALSINNAELFIQNVTTTLFCAASYRASIASWLDSHGTFSSGLVPVPSLTSAIVLARRDWSVRFKGRTTAAIILDFAEITPCIFLFILFKLPGFCLALLSAFVRHRSPNLLDVRSLTVFQGEFIQLSAIGLWLFLADEHGTSPLPRSLWTGADAALHRTPIPHLGRLQAARLSRPRAAQARSTPPRPLGGGRPPRAPQLHLRLPPVGAPAAGRARPAVAVARREVGVQAVHQVCASGCWEEAGGGAGGRCRQGRGRHCARGGEGEGEAAAQAKGEVGAAADVWVVQGEGREEPMVDQATAGAAAQEIRM